MTKKEIVAKLEAAGIAFDPKAKPKDLRELLSQIPPENIQPGNPEAPSTPEAPATEPSKAGKDEVVVKFRDHQGKPTERVFSKEVHGKDYAKLAEEFKKKHAKRIIK